VSLHPHRLINRVPMPGRLPGLKLVNQRRERLRLPLFVRLRRYELGLRHNPAFEAGVDEAPRILQTAYGSRYVSCEQFTLLIHGLSIPPIVQIVKCISRPASEPSSPSFGRDGMLPEPSWREARSWAPAPTGPRTHRRPPGYRGVSDLQPESLIRWGRAGAGSGLASMGPRSAIRTQ